MRHLDDVQGFIRQESKRVESGVQTNYVVNSQDSICGFQDEKIEQAKKAIQDHIDQHKELKRMQTLIVSIPGICHPTVSKILGEIRNILDFQSAHLLAAYAG